MSNGYYYAGISDISLECYDPPSGFNKNYGNKAYYYQSTFGTNDTVAIGNNNTVLSSFLATGDNPTYCPASQAGCSKPDSGSKTSTTSSATSSATPQTVPGMSGGGNAGNSGTTESGDTSGSANSNSGQSAGTSGSGTSSGGGSTSFDQGLGTGSSSGSGGSSSSEASSVVAGSAVALLGFFAAALML